MENDNQINYKKGQIVVIRNPVANSWWLTPRNEVVTKLLTTPGTGRLPDNLVQDTFISKTAQHFKDICLCEVTSLTFGPHMFKINNKPCLLINREHILRSATTLEKKTYYKSKQKSK